jgi:hypothetical protein
MNNLGLGNISGTSGPSANFGSKEFMESNSLVAKVAFLLLVVVLFVIALRALTFIAGYFVQTTGSPHMIDGMIDAKQMKVIEVDPNIKGAKPISRSVNENGGLEFTWSTWLFVDDLDYMKGSYKHVFHKGNDDFKTTGDFKGLNYPNNAPGLYFTPKGNNMVVVLNTFNDIVERITIENIPMNKWYNVTIRVESQNVDIYVNGTIVNRHILKDVVRQNYDKVYMSMNGGFSGYTSDLWYYDYALSTSELQALVDKGPNMTLLGDSMMDGVPKYFSLRWFFRNVGAVDSGFGGI